MTVALLLGLASVQADPSSPSDNRFQQLIRQLGDSDYNVRERAQSELAKFGFAAYEALNVATSDEDLEIASRARYLLRLIRVEWSQPNDPQAVKDLLDDYDTQSPDDRLKRIRLIIRLSQNQGLAAGCRLVRYEQSQVLSKLAALEILDRVPSDPALRETWAKTIQENIGQSTRPGAKWLSTYARLVLDPQEPIDQWNALVAAEQNTLRQSPHLSGTSIVVTLLYHLASVQLAGGQTEEAEKTAQRARSLNPSKEPGALLVHLETAAALRRRGQTIWAEGEYRYVTQADAGDMAGMAYVYLAEMYHDDGQNLKAAEAVEEIFKLSDKKLIDNVDIFGRSAGELRARAFYFQACHWEQQGDRAKQQSALDEALKHCPSEVDTLIACHQLPNQSPDYRRRIQELIKKATADMHRQVDNDPEDANAYNQYAWLAGNTGGDFREALRCAQKAVELSPDSGAYYDTLAHVYAGNGDYQNAVKYQARAAELEPHSGLIVQKLKVFQERLKATSAGEASPTP